MPKAIAAIFAIVIVAGVGMYGLEAALANAGDDQLIEAESFTPTADTIVQLNNSDREHVYYDKQVEVYNSSDVRMADGVDYEWYDNNGTIEPLGSGDLAGDPNAEITYGLQVTTDEQRELTALLGLVPNLIGLVLPIFGFVLILIILRG